MGLQRYLRLQGVAAKPLGGSVSSPKDHIDALVSLISAATGIPRRILMGTEEGQLAGSQDERAWLGKVQERRNTYAAPFIMRQLIDRLQALGVLPATKRAITIVWPTIDLATPKDKADISRMRTESLARYADSNAPNLIAPFQFLTHEMGYSDDEARELLEAGNMESPLEEGEDEGSAG